MFRLIRGNLLEVEAEAVVNTVNTVGVMGKGIALQFKEAFPENFAAYREACQAGEVRIGRMFVTENPAPGNPRWLVNFPTKKHWRHPARVEWIREGLRDLRRVVEEKGIRSIAVPPLGCGNGGLEWERVRPEIELALGDLPDVDVLLYEPTAAYRGRAKHAGVEELTPARALIAELVRRYWVLGIECSLLEVQKLAWFLDRSIRALGAADVLKLTFKAHVYGPYSDRLRHLLDALDGSYLRCDKRLADARPLDTIWFDEDRRDRIHQYLQEQVEPSYVAALDRTSRLIDGFESPLGMELLATVDWLISDQGVEASVEGIKSGLRSWPGGQSAARRKQRLFDERLIGLALEQLARHPVS